MPSSASTNPRVAIPAHTVCARESVPTMPRSVATASSTICVSGSTPRFRFFGASGAGRRRRNQSGCVRYTLTIARRSVNTSVV